MRWGYWRCHSSKVIRFQNVSFVMQHLRTVYMYVNYITFEKSQ